MKTLHDYVLYLNGVAFAAIQTNNASEAEATHGLDGVVAVLRSVAGERDWEDGLRRECVRQERKTNAPT